MKFYVVTEPASIRGIYEGWPRCEAAVKGVAGARFQRVNSRGEAEALLGGTGVIMPPGRYAFTDGNAKGGVGVVIVNQGAGGAVESAQEISTSVREVFEDAQLPGLKSEVQVSEALAGARNILAELAALYRALMDVPDESAVTIVYDYKGVGSWMEGHWTSDGGPVLAGVIEACLALRDRKQLHLTFRHQPGHTSVWVGRNDFASWNRRADHLATVGGERPANE